MSTFIIAQNSTSPVLTATLTDSTGNPVNLTAATTVKFVMVSADGTTTIINANATIVAPLLGQVTYVWVTGNTATAGTFLSRFKVTWANNSITEFPDQGFDRVVISPDIPSLAPIPTPTWTYSGDPSTSSRDAVRFLIADTNSASQLLQDPEIDWLLVQYIGYYAAAAEAARVLGARFAALAQSKHIGDLSVTYGARSAEFFKLAQELKVQATRTDLVPMPYAGGISEADKDIDGQDPDIIHRLKVSPIPDMYKVP